MFVKLAGIELNGIAAASGIPVESAYMTGTYCSSCTEIIGVFTLQSSSTALANPRRKWRFIAGNTNYTCWFFQQTMFDNTRGYMVCNWTVILLPDISAGEALCYYLSSLARSSKTKAPCQIQSPNMRLWKLPEGISPYIIIISEFIIIITINQH